MSKLLWMLLPIALYGSWLIYCIARDRMPSRRRLNMQTSLLLMVYLLVTSGLGIFWVANQQLPVFDWHYLFGYGTLLLVVVHLSFNLPPLWRTLRRKGRPQTESVSRQRWITGLVVLAWTGLAFTLGIRYGTQEIEIPWTADAVLQQGPVDAVIQYHEYSSHSDLDVFARATDVDWGPEEEPFKHYEGDAIALPEAWASGRSLDAAIRGESASEEILDLDALAQILFHTGGVTEDDGSYKLRAAPTSGALAPTEIYLQAAGVDGLADGAYHYDAERHHLVRLGDGRSGLSTTEIYLTLVFRRTGQKYHDRAYRYAVADAGHMIENLRLAAGDYGVRATPLQRFDESQIRAALGLYDPGEGVIAAVPLGGGPVPQSVANWRYPGPPEITDIGVTGVVQQATSLRQVVESGEALPAPVTLSEPVLETIRARRSSRRFSNELLPLDQLSALLAASAEPGFFLSRSIVTRLVVNRVEGLSPGLYRYIPESHSLIQERSEELGDEAYRTAFSQDVIGDASVVFLMSADRDTIFVDHGSRGYRHAFLEVGMASERILLGAQDQGLNACPVGAFFDDDAAKLIGSTMEEEWVLHFIGLGGTP